MYSTDEKCLEREDLKPKTESSDAIEDLTAKPESQVKGTIREGEPTRV